MEPGRKQGENDTNPDAASNDWQQPQAGDGDMHQGLKRLPPKTHGKEPGPAGLHKVRPLLPGSVEVIEDNTEYKKPQTAAHKPDVSISRRFLRHLQPHQPERKSGGEEKLRHDGVRIAAPCPVMLENFRGDEKASQPVHDEHPRHGIAAKLVEGGEASVGWLIHLMARVAKKHGM